MRRAVGFVIAGLCMPAVLRAQIPLPQFGLRLDSRSSLQWHRDWLYAEGAERSVVRLAIDSIVDVWPGPVQGAFGVVSRQGIGMLYGTNVIRGGGPFEPDAILRSARTDVILACVAEVGGQQRRRIVEVRTGNRQRVLFTSSSEIVDFDADVANRLVVLTRDGHVRFVTAPNRAIPIELGPIRDITTHRPLRRVFIDDVGSEIAVYSDSVLARLTVASGAWTRTPVDPRTDALVRHAVSRRIRVEPRFLAAGR